MGFPKDYLILWKNVSVLDFAIYNMTSTHTLHVNMQICLVEKITPKVIDLLPCRTITSFVPPSSHYLKKQTNSTPPQIPRNIYSNALGSNLIISSVPSVIS